MISEGKRVFHRQTSLEEKEVEPWHKTPALKKSTSEKTNKMQIATPRDCFSKCRKRRLLGCTADSLALYQAGGEGRGR